MGSNAADATVGRVCQDWALSGDNIGLDWVVGRRIIGLCCGLIVAWCVVPGSMWLANMQDQALTTKVNQALAGENVSATVAIRGRVATLSHVDPQHAQAAASIVGGVPGISWSMLALGNVATAANAAT